MYWLRKAKERMERVTPPAQSKFRVYAIITYTSGTDRMLKWVSGTNSECAYIGSSLCAERSAAVQLREVPHGYRVRAVYLISDLLDILTPGMLCREYLANCCGTMRTPVIMASADLTKTRIATLEELFPCPSPYRQGRCRPCGSPPRVSEDDIPTAFRDIFRTLREKYATKRRRDDGLHSIRYCTGVQFGIGGDIVVEYMRKGLEYGTVRKKREGG